MKEWLWWAAIRVEDGHLAAVSRHQQNVRERMGMLFDRDDPRRGWRMARKRGYRVVLVRVTWSTPPPEAARG